MHLPGTWQDALVSAEEAAHVIARPLSVFARSLQLGEVPEGWKKSDVTPTFRKEDLGQYRSVSLTSKTY